MNQEKIGKFILKLRKEKGMTQQDLADKLGITDRAVSKWENGRGLPDLSLLKSLCDELVITINELLSGEKLNKNDYQEKFEENVVNVVNELNKNSKKKIKCLHKILVCYLILCLLFLTITFSYFMYNFEMFKQEYQEGKMFMTKENNQFVFSSSIQGSVTSKLLKANEEMILFINYKSSLKEIRDYDENQAISSIQLLNNIKNSENINKVYYTNYSLNKINSNNIDNIIKKSILIYENSK